jgi:hypothetical protein
MQSVGRHSVRLVRGQNRVEMCEHSLLAIELISLYATYKHASTLGSALPSDWVVGPGLELVWLRAAWGRGHVQALAAPADAQTLPDGRAALPRLRTVLAEVIYAVRQSSC